MDKVKNLLSPLASGTMGDTLVSPKKVPTLAKVCQLIGFISLRNLSLLVERWKPPAEPPSPPGTVSWTVIQFPSCFAHTTHAQREIPPNSFLPYCALLSGGLSGKWFSTVVYVGHPKLNWRRFTFPAEVRLVRFLFLVLFQSH